MPVFRVERNTGYTVMSNHHLRNKSLSLKAKGLLSQMLSLPEDWDYTLAGLSIINREKIDAVREAVKELEKEGYIVRSRQRDEKGCLRGADYIIYEQPQLPTSDLPTLENPILDNPTLENPTLENPTQLNKDINIKDSKNTDGSITDSLPFPSPNPSPCESRPKGKKKKRKRKKEKTERNGKETNNAYQVYEQIIKENIEYESLCERNPTEKDRINEILDTILEVVCTSRRTIRIAGDDYPADIVKAKFLRLNSEHIEFVMTCMQENTTKIRCIKQYLRAVLYNAPSTIDNYYTALVSHDLNKPIFE